jgi:hypothetical protein
MGRAEKRAKERQNRIEAKKGTIRIRPEELNRIKKDITYKASGYHTEALMTCFALAMARKGMSDDDIIECLRYIDGLMNDILEDRKTMEDYFAELEAKTGLVVRSE